MKLANQDGVLTAIVGSYPKPSYIYSKSGRQLLDDFGFAFGDYGDNKQSLSEFDRKLDMAALQAINDQDEAGLNIVSDGEERRGHYVLSIASKLNGIDFHTLKQISIRNGILRSVPRITGKISYAGPILLKEFRFTSQHAKHMPKIALPGPTTFVDTLADEYYGDPERIAYDYADSIRQEVEALINTGCRIIQFDDPVLLRHPEAAKKWGLNALERCLSSFEDRATFVVHICRGYPDKTLEKRGIDYKANQQNYQDELRWLASSKLDIISIEGAQGNLDLSVLRAAGDKAVMLGLLDVGTEQVESVASLVERGKEALKYLPKDQLILSPDCGMLEISRTASRRKLANLVRAATLLNAASNPTSLNEYSTVK